VAPECLLQIPEYLGPGSEETIATPQLGSRVLTFDYADLLAEGNEFQTRVISGAKEDTEPREKSQKKPDHGPSLHDTVPGNAGSASR
jgi:hypothetical protein